MKKIISILSVLLISSISAYAQQKATPDWQTDLKSEIKWQQVTPYDILLVGKSDGLSGIDPETGKVLWNNNSLLNLDESSLQTIENSPFIQIASKGEVPVIYIFEPFEGNIVFNSANAGIKEVFKSWVLTETMTLLVQGTTTNKIGFTVFMFDIAKGKKLWQKDDMYGEIKAFAEVIGREFVVATRWKIYKINSLVGSVTWEKPVNTELEAELQNLKKTGDTSKIHAKHTNEHVRIPSDFYFPNENKFIYSYQFKKNKSSMEYFSGFKCMNLSDGSSVWKENIELSGEKGLSINGNNGMIVCPHQGDKTWINKIDYETGSKKWGKDGNGLIMNGYVNDYRYTDRGILLISEEDNKSGSKIDYLINIIDTFYGTLTFSNNVKMKGTIETVEVLPSGLFYSTDKEADIINLETGNVLFEKPVNTSSHLSISLQDVIFVFSPSLHSLFKIDKSSGVKTKFSNSEIKFKGNEIPSEIEARNDGIVLAGMQNITLVGYDGSIKYQQYYVAPTLPGINKTLNAALGVTICLGTIACAVPLILSPKLIPQYTVFAEKGFTYAGKFIKAVYKRFKATANSMDFIFILTEGENKKDNRLVRINKDSGAVIDYVSLGKDIKPNYEVDNYSGQIYYCNAPTQISCYKFLGAGGAK